MQLSTNDIIKTILSTTCLKFGFVHTSNAILGIKSIKDHKLDDVVVDLYKPDRKLNTPVMLLIHGGAWNSGDKSSMASIGRMFASNGVTAISIQYRLLSETVTPTQQYQHVKYALDVIKRHHAALNIDLNRIGVLGVSAGGHLAALLSTEPGAGIKASVIFCGPNDLTNREGLTPEANHQLDDYLKSNDDNFIKSLSPAFRLDEHSSPSWILIHGEHDELIPAQQSRNFHQKLIEQGFNASYVELEGQGHYPKEPRMKKKAFFSVFNFLQKNYI